MALDQTKPVQKQTSSVGGERSRCVLCRLPTPTPSSATPENNANNSAQPATIKLMMFSRLGTAFLRPQPHPSPTGAVASEGGDQAAGDGAGCSVTAAVTG